MKTITNKLQINDNDNYKAKVLDSNRALKDARMQLSYILKEIQNENSVHPQIKAFACTVLKSKHLKGKVKKVLRYSKAKNTPKEATGVFYVLQALNKVLVQSQKPMPKAKSKATKKVA